ncbi:hypothetical protein B0H13DRAFT_2300257 [Mycena leptocephala]|nr:hypothetical protein B0H13DRAFT_2300257 [Mycena leptocephala]
MSVSRDKMCTDSRAKFPGSSPLSTLDTFGTTESLDVDCHKPLASSHSTPVTRVGEKCLDVKRRKQSGEATIFFLSLVCNMITFLRVTNLESVSKFSPPSARLSLFLVLQLKLKQTARRTRTVLTQVSEQKKGMAGTKVVHSSLVDALNYAATRIGSK